MLPDKKYINLPEDFWAHVKLMSESLGYSERGADRLRTYKAEEIEERMRQIGLSIKHLGGELRDGQTYLSVLTEYLNYRGKVIQDKIKTNLMDRNKARKIFKALVKKFKPKCKLPINKQKGDKKHRAYLTCIINILTENVLSGFHFEQDPRKLLFVTIKGKPIKTFTRRFDGAFPGLINPKAIWEIKEFYGTTTFGSRVADGIYESLLDGEELMSLLKTTGIHIRHYLIIDDYFTWWVKGKSYLCRILDMLHMGYLDEAIFGREVVSRWPKIVRSWKS